jgi:integrase
LNVEEHRMTTSKTREAKGGAFESRGRYFMHVTVAPQQRRGQLLPWCSSLEDAKVRAGIVQALVNRLRAAGEVDFVEKVVEIGAKADEAKLDALDAKVTAITGGKFERLAPVSSKTGPVTFRKFAERWTSGELARLDPDHVAKKKTADDDQERLKNHVYPHVEEVPLVSFTREHADAVMTKLPAAMKRGTRRHVAQLINRVLRLAVLADVIKLSPLPAGWLPRAPKAESVGKESLLPSEEAKLLRGTNEAGEVVVPVRYRVAYAFLHREGVRKSEARYLLWGDIDLERGIVSLDENKTDRPRSWVLDPAVLRVFAFWKKSASNAKATDRVFDKIKWAHLAIMYRTHCEAVGIKRERLYQRKVNKLRLRAHDIRAYFVTASMFIGRDVLWITDRTGHTTLGMLRRYERDVRHWRELGETLVDVDTAMLEVAAANAAAKRGSETEPPPPSRSLIANESGWFRRRDSNPDKRIQNPLSCH